MEQLMRNFFLFLAKNKWLTKLAKRYGLRFGAGRFVAGATLESSITAIKRLNEKGMPVTIDHLGEFVDNEQEAAEMTEHCIEAIKAISKEKLDSQLSLKMTSMGLDISDELVLSNMRKIMETAKKHNVFITIDMEDYTRCEKTLEIFKQLKSEYDNISTVIQAYLYRSLEDVQSLDEYHPNLRLVKGAYKEPETVAYPEKSDVDNNFKKLIETHLLNGNYTAVATHDDAIIQYTKDLVEKHNIPYDQFEFQMLYGIRVERQDQLMQEGYKMRIYVPYGNDWYGYFMRRLAERPANVLFVLKGVFGK
ncbi:proline dehydrogenase family protein [Fictibacillus barbaricus]|uniref:proline dehydrogenase n=1 Tax=Fictibacillus barbaricus TaxID=182136 RepID=A0ABS2ZGF4_9BACL|nr:proline dehydrogenase [Fictibacillus barbaricus]MBN3547035.1 proline dehydrogenase [Fictibacillus barbaricus]GGB45966.1 proline dehydrogenase [Fictibacillus barbaricus]